jgi:hypothetical protein
MKYINIISLRCILSYFVKLSLKRIYFENYFLFEYIQYIKYYLLKLHTAYLIEKLSVTALFLLRLKVILSRSKKITQVSDQHVI